MLLEHDKQLLDGLSRDLGIKDVPSPGQLPADDVAFRIVLQNILRGEEYQQSKGLTTKWAENEKL